MRSNTIFDFPLYTITIQYFFNSKLFVLNVVIYWYNEVISI